jgi:hypothetical protein
MFASMDAPLKNYALLAPVQLITSWVKYLLITNVKFSNLSSFKSNPP